MIDYRELRKAILLEVGFRILGYPAHRRHELASHVQGEGTAWLSRAIKAMLPTYLAVTRRWK
jgi:hypothetical protein